jgi:hypothetical protein
VKKQTPPKTATDSFERGERIYDLNHARYESDGDAYDKIAAMVNLQPEELRQYCEKRQADRNALLELTIEVLVGYQFTLNTWMPYLEPETKITSEKQKDLAFSILMGCVSDWCQQINSSAGKGVYSKIEALNTHSARESVLTVFSVNIFSAEFMTRLSPKEQVFLRIARDRVVHGYLEGYTKATRGFEIVSPLENQNQPFVKQTWTRDQQLEAVNEIGNGDLWLGVRQLRKKYSQHLDLLCQYLKRVRDLPPDQVRAALLNGHYIFDPDLDKDYRQFKEKLDQL